MLTREAILERLQQNMRPNGISRFDYSSDLPTKRLELELLKELESEGRIQRLTVSLGFAIYQMF